MSNQQQQVMNDLLVEAVQSRDVTQAKLYVQKGANVNQRLSVREKTVSGNNISYDRTTAPLIHMATGDNYFNEQMIDFLISAGADIDAKSGNGNTPLMLAVKDGNAYRTKFYLNRGADPLATNQKGEMVLQEAQRLSNAVEKRQEIINVLLAKIDDQSAITPAQAIQDNKQDVTVPQGKIDVMKPVSIGRKTKPAGGGNSFEL
jgi:ankyrin repeat protein